MEFNQHLKKLREEENLTQEELALRLNISRSAIAKWEQGKGMPSLELLKSLALFFHTSIDSLLGEEGIKRLEKSHNQKYLITSLIAVAALVIATLSTTLLILNKNEMLVTEQTKYVLIDSLTRQGDTYEINYVDNGKIRQFEVNASDVVFRNESSLDINLSPQDYIKVTLLGDRANQVTLIDNLNETSLKGYEINFANDHDTDSYYYHEYHKTDGSLNYMATESTITSIENSHLTFALRQYESVVYNHSFIKHTVLVDRDLSNYHLFNLNAIYVAEKNGQIHKTPIGNYASGILDRLNFTLSGFTNSYAYTGDDYNVRDVISYDVDVTFIDTVNLIRVKEFNENNLELSETTLDYTSDLSAFKVSANASYIRYYVEDSIKGNTIEVGEQETIYFKTNTPLPLVYKLKI